MQASATLGIAGDKNGKLLALTTGFVAPPFGLMHCDTLQVRGYQANSTSCVL